MQILDIHSHILAAVDDGARDIETSLAILRMMREQGITDVVATPHFDAAFDDIDHFKAKVARAYADLALYAKDEQLPNIFVGSEVYYFKQMGRSQGLYDLTIGGSRYILIELSTSSPIEKNVLKDIEEIYDNLGLVPIIAHIERYYELQGFKGLLKLISNGSALSQINAQAVLSKEQGRVCKKLIKRGLVTFIATDAHSVERRPPMLERALQEIASTFGEKYRDTFIKNSQRLCHEIEASNAK